MTTAWTISPSKMSDTSRSTSGILSRLPPWTWVLNVAVPTLVAAYSDKSSSYELEGGGDEIVPAEREIDTLQFATERLLPVINLLELLRSLFAVLSAVVGEGPEHTIRWHGVDLPLRCPRAGSDRGFYSPRRDLTWATLSYVTKCYNTIPRESTHGENRVDVCRGLVSQ